jgi:hypothetical protein
MAVKKTSKQEQTAKDREEARKFMIVLGVSTIVLMLLVYFLTR